MKTSARSSILLGLFLSMAVSSAALAQTGFTATYRGGSGTCGTTYSIQGKEPTTTGRFPVFIFTVGTTESYTHASALAAVDEAVALGFVAATVQYPNSSFGSCSTLEGRAKCIFDAASSTSAVSTLCARAKADCSKGVVVAGFSQGSILAILAKDYDARVQAAYGLGAGTAYSFYNLSSCVANGNRVLPSSRLRVVNGEQDGFMGGTESSVRTQVQAMTGLTCTSTSTSCFQSNGAGWYLVQDAEASDGAADHCYMRQGGCTASGLDQKWRFGTYDWALKTNVSWLKQFVTP